MESLAKIESKVDKLSESIISLKADITATLDLRDRVYTDEMKSHQREDAEMFKDFNVALRGDGTPSNKGIVGDLIEIKEMLKNKRGLPKFTVGNMITITTIILSALWLEATRTVQMNELKNEIPSLSNRIEKNEFDIRTNQNRVDSILIFDRR